MVAAQLHERQQRLAQRQQDLGWAKERAASAPSRGRHVEAEVEARAAVRAAEEQVDCVEFLQHLLQAVQQPGGLSYERELLRDICSSLRGGTCPDQQLLALVNRLQEYTFAFGRIEDAMCLQSTLLLSFVAGCHGSEPPMAERAAAEREQHQAEQRAQDERRRAPPAGRQHREGLCVVQPSSAATAAAGPGPGGLTGWGAMEQRRQELLAPATLTLVRWLRLAFDGQLPAELAVWLHEMERLEARVQASSGSEAAAARAELSRQWRQKLAFIMRFMDQVGAV